MPRPWTIVRWVSAAFALSGSVLMLGALAWELIRDGNLHTGGAPLAILSPGNAAVMAVWLVSCIVAGWLTMDREARA